MPTETSRNTVAIYWDFENLHAALYERDWAESRSYTDSRYAQQDVLINIKAVMDYAAGIGAVAINRAYNNWQWFARYRDALNVAGVDLVQIYPKGARAKNGADIRLALDVLEDVFRYPKLTHIIIVSSDSDFISLAQKLKQSGLVVIGIGVQQKTNFYWAQNCDEFRDYDGLLGMAEGAAQAAPVALADDEEEPSVKAMTLDEAKALMLDALRRLVAEKGTEQIPKSTLKYMMKRMNPTFDESNFGFLSFSSFLKPFADVVETIPDTSGGQVRLRTAAEQTGVEGEQAQAIPVAAEQDYEVLLKRGNVIRLLPSPWWRTAVELVDQIFKEAPMMQLTSFDDLEGRLAARLEAGGQDGSPELVHKLRGFLFSLRQFSLDKEKQTIGLRTQATPLLKCVEREMVRRIAKLAAPPIDVEKVAVILYGDEAPDKLEEARSLIDSFTQKEEEKVARQDAET